MSLAELEPLANTSGMTDTTHATEGDHPNVARWREMREAFFRGDIEPALALYAPDIEWTNDEAAGPIAGTHRGVEAVLGMLGAGMEAFEGTLAQEVHATLASDDFVVEVMTERATVKGHEFHNRAVYVYRLEGGQIVEVTTHDRDRDAARSFWDAVEAS
jgi:ketosteroid isomerase-like protein